MIIIKKKPNVFDLKEVTTGKLLAIKRALECAQTHGQLGAVGVDVLSAIDASIRKENEKVATSN